MRKVGVSFFTLILVVLIVLPASSPNAGGVFILDYWAEQGGDRVSRDGKPGITSDPPARMLYVTTSERVQFNLDKWSYADCVFVYSPEVVCPGCGACTATVGDYVECITAKSAVGFDSNKHIEDVEPWCDRQGAGLLIHLENWENVNRFGITLFTLEEKDRQAITVVRIPDKNITNDNWHEKNIQLGLEHTGGPIIKRIPLHYIDPNTAIKYIANAAPHAYELHGSIIMFPDGTSVEVPKPAKGNGLPKLTTADLLNANTKTVWFLSHYDAISKVEFDIEFEFKDVYGFTYKQLVSGLLCMPYTRKFEVIEESDVASRDAAQKWVTNHKEFIEGYIAHFEDQLPSHSSGDISEFTTYMDAQFKGHYGFTLRELITYAKGGMSNLACLPYLLELPLPPPRVNSTLEFADAWSWATDSQKLGFMDNFVKHYRKQLGKWHGQTSGDDLNKATEQYLDYMNGQFKGYYDVSLEEFLNFVLADNSLDRTTFNSYLIALDMLSQSSATMASSVMSTSPTCEPCISKTIAGATLTLRKQSAKPAPKTTVKINKPAEEDSAAADEDKDKEEPEFSDLHVAPANAIIYQGSAAGAKYLERFLKELDYAPRRIKLRVHICEIREDGLKELGIDVGPNVIENQHFVEQGSSKGNFEAFSLGNFHRATGLTFTTLIGTLIQEGKAKILAEPTLTTVEDQVAVYSALRKIPYSSGTLLDTDSNTITENIEYEEVGIVLKFKPRLGHGDTLTIDVRPTISSLLDTSVEGGNSRAATGGLVAPEFFERQLNSIVSVRNGEPFVVAGMIDERMQVDINKVPILSEFPLIGKLFEKKRKDVNRTEVCIIVIPEILEDIALPVTEDENGNE